MDRSMNRARCVLTFAALLSAAAVAGDFAPGDEAAGAGRLLGDVPGLRISVPAPHQIAFYGMPMAAGQDADAAIVNFLRDYSGAFGVDGIELNETFRSIQGYGKFTAYGYSQTIDGIPVEYGIARILVLNGNPAQVVYVAGNIAQPPAAGTTPTITPAEALAIAQAESFVDRNDATQNFGQFLPEWSQPELAIFFGDGQYGDSQLAWKFVGQNDGDASNYRFTFFVDAHDGSLIEARDDVHFTDVSGTTTGMATPGDAPDTASNPATAQPMPEVRMTISGGNNAFTDRDGNYTISNGGSAAVTVTSNISSGRWVDVNNNAGSDIAVSGSVTPPGPGNFLFNPAPSALTTAQTNAFIHTNNIHNYIRDRANFTAIDTVMPANVNIASTCNAFYNGSSINFYQAGGGCANTAYSTVVTHEYGHHIVNRLGLAQGAFGEGYSDTCSIMVYDTGIIGRDFCGTGCHVRNPNTANQQYPCSSSAIHTCGQIIGGCTFDIKQGFKTKYGADPGLEMARQLHVDWSMITIGGISLNSAHPQTAVEWLTVNDDDGNLDNGTPDYAEICQAFTNHNIDCPPISAIIFEYPAGRPASLTPGQTTDIDVNVVGVSATPTPGSGTVSYSVNGGGFTTVAMAHHGSNQYTATLPAVNCGDIVNYYFSSGSTAGTISDPTTAPAATFSVAAAYGSIDVFSDNFETNQGWTVNGTATDGQWDRGVPVNCVRGDPPSDGDGSGQCFLTDNSAASACNSDVDGGYTRLVSPVLNLSGLSGTTVSYLRWYDNTFGADPGNDVFRVEVSNNGSAWVTVEVVGPSSVEASGGWYYHEFIVDDFVSPTANVQVRFSAEDAGAGSVVEAAVDAFNVAAIDCTPPTSCPEDLDGDGDVDLADLSVLLAHFGLGGGANPEDGDIDGDHDVDLADLSLMLAAFGQPCP